ncbi:hypothetical protein, partial [Thermogutta sp.]|uniref:hypothetical protein n=1 Tax=Thermogutta sp. TaxID=1962930 RepID=UPI003220247A
VRVSVSTRPRASYCQAVTPVASVIAVRRPTPLAPWSSTDAPARFIGADEPPQGRPERSEGARPEY